MATKLKRIFMTIRRGMTDKTAVCVFPWERPLIEEIHGASAEVISIDEMCSEEGVKSVQSARKAVGLKMTRVGVDGREIKADVGLDLRGQLEAQARVAEEDDPTDNAMGEYGRMVDKYGMHPKVDMPVVERVYGGERVFRKCLREFAAGRTPEFLDDGGAQAEPSDEEVEMSRDELKRKLRDRGIPFKENALQHVLERLLNEHEAEAA
jgi:hypothetical protein